MYDGSGLLFAPWQTSESRETVWWVESKKEGEVISAGVCGR